MGKLSNDRFPCSLRRVAALLPTLLAVHLVGCWNPLDPGEDEPLIQVSIRICGAEDPTLSPDGEMVAWSGISVANIDGSEVRLLTPGASPDWSPDGSRIVFTGGWDIYTIKIDGDSLTQLTFGGTGIQPAWSPDGTQVAYVGFASGSQSIWIMDADGSNQRNLDLGGGSGPDWSPDGTRIVFGRYQASEAHVWISDLEGNAFQIEDEGRENLMPSWSPDGAKIAFRRTESSSRSPTYGFGGSQIWIMNVDGSHQRQLTRAGGKYPAWTSDGRSIVYSVCGLEGGGLAIVNADGTGKRRLPH